MTSFDVRKATKDDYDAVMCLLKQLVSHDKVSQRSREQFLSILNSDFLHIILALDAGGKPIAHCVLAVMPNMTRGGAPFAVIENVVVHESMRRRGAGKAVVNAALKIALEDELCYKVILAARMDEVAAHHFYRKLGFTDGSKLYFEMRPMVAAEL